MEKLNFKEKLSSAIEAYTDQIKQYLKVKKQARIEEDSKPFYEDLPYDREFLEIDENGNIIGVRHIYDNNNTDYDVHTIFNNDGTVTVKEYGDNNGVKFFAKNVYNSDSPKPILSDTLWNNKPVMESSRHLYRMLENQLFSDPDKAIIYSSWPVSLKGTFEYGKNKTLKYFDYLKQEAKQKLNNLTNNNE